MSARVRMPVTVHILIRRGARILLLRRRGTGYEDGNYSVPAGHLDGGEHVLDAATREAREECGIELVEAAVVGVMHRRSGADERIDFFVAVRRYEGSIVNAEPETCDELAFHRLDHLPPNVIPYVRAALGHSARRPWYMAYGWPDGARAETDPCPPG